MAGMRGVILGLGLACLALTACATQPQATQPPGSTASPSPSASASGSPSAAPNVIVGEARTVSPRPGMTATHPVTWQAARMLSDRVLRVYFYAGPEPCDALDSVQVD